MDKAPGPSLRELEKQVLADQFHGIVIGGGDLTVVELVEKYVATRTGVRSSTKAGYQTTINFLKKDFFGQKRIDQIHISDAKLWLIKLQQRDGKGYSTIHTIRGILRPAFQLAFEDDLIRRNPFDFEMIVLLVKQLQETRKESI